MTYLPTLLLGWALPLAALALPAFPGAQGFGAEVTSGGRGGQVIYVTNLDCQGPGSLNQALATPGAKYVLFKVSGIIDCAAEILWGDVTLAGQTSPGGIIVRGILADDWYEPEGSAQNIIIRHLNSRPNQEENRPGQGWVLDDALRLDGARQVVVDHCTFANAIDESVQISRSSDLSIQYSILAETLGEHYALGGMLLNYSVGELPQDRISIHHNLWMRIGGRMPEISCEQSGDVPQDQTCLNQPMHLELSNNLLWDQQIQVWYGNEFQPGEPQPAGNTLVANLVGNLSYARPSYGGPMFLDALATYPANQLHVQDNRMNLYPEFADLELFYCCNDFVEYGPNTEPATATMLATRAPFPAISYTPASSLLRHLATKVGAFNARSPRHRDRMNRRFALYLESSQIDPFPVDGQDYYQDAFLLDYQAPPAPPQDSDTDGMPDDWETAHGLNPLVQDHNGSELSISLTGVNGYTNLECYLNQLADGLLPTRERVVRLSKP